MSLVAAYIVPHPPLAVPEVGRGEERAIQATIDGYKEVAARIARHAPETIVIISPHTAYFADWIHIAGGSEAEGDLSQFRAPEVRITLTYNEPLIAPEYLMDVGRLTKEAGLVLAVVTNGYAAPETFDAACSVTDAMNIDLKCFTEEGYAKLGAPSGLACVTRNIRAAHEADVHVEVTTLIVPGISDSVDAFREEVAWLASVSPDIPLHLTRFFPTYKMTDESPTDIALMHRFQEIAQESLHHVLLGNI